jgi:hypothetical protein
MGIRCTHVAESPPLSTSGHGAPASLGGREISSICSRHVVSVRIQPRRDAAGRKREQPRVIRRTQFLHLKRKILSSDPFSPHGPGALRRQSRNVHVRDLVHLASGAQPGLLLFRGPGQYRDGIPCERRSDSGPTLY